MKMRALLISICLLLIICLPVNAQRRSRLVKSYDQLMTDLKNPDPKIRNQAVKDLGDMREQAKSAYPQLIELMQNDPADYVRSNAASALGDIKAVEAVPVMIAALKSGDDGVKYGAIVGLG